MPPSAPEKNSGTNCAVNAESPFYDLGWCHASLTVFRMIFMLNLRQ